MVVAAVGCGGGENPAVPTNPFVGGWTGTWVAPDMEQGGSTSVFVGQSGAVTGILHNVVLEEDADLEGHITANGDVTGAVTYPDGESYDVTGDVTIDEEGHLVGVLHQAVGNTTIDIEVDLARDAG
jgi:hypothetical protein